MKQNYKNKKEIFFMFFLYLYRIKSGSLFDQIQINEIISEGHSCVDKIRKLLKSSDLVELREDFNEKNSDNDSYT